MTMYLTGATNDVIEARMIELGVGLMLNPRSAYQKRVARYASWAADNGCYAAGNRFDAARWLRWLAQFTPHTSTCLFAVLPDVFGDGPATVARSLPHIDRIRDLGLPAALVLQPGVTSTEIPWDDLQAVFTGGPDSWQTSEACLALVEEGRRRGLWLHRGRVNSGKRYAATRAMGYDSCDGTYVAFNPRECVERVETWQRWAPQRSLWEAE